MYSVGTQQVCGVTIRHSAEVWYNQQALSRGVVYSAGTQQGCSVYLLGDRFLTFLMREVHGSRAPCSPDVLWVLSGRCGDWLSTHLPAIQVF